MRFKLAIVAFSAAIVAFGLASCGGSGTTSNAPSPTPNTAPSSASPAPPSTLETEFVAHGNEPFWSIETHADRIVYSAPERPDGETLGARVSQAGGWTRFDAEMGDVPLLLEVRKAPCTDDMSGFAFSHQARLTRADGTWQGCARLASEPQTRE